MMKVLLITTDIDHIEPYQYTGMSEKGAEVRVICDPTAINLDIFSKADIPVFTVPFFARRDKRTIRFIKQHIDEFAPDVVHVLRKKALSNTIPAMKHCAAKLVAYRGIVGNLSFIDPVSRMTFLNPRIDRIVCVAEAIRQHFLKMGWGPMRLDPKKVITIHKGHRTEKYQQVAKTDMSQYGIGGGDKVIACTGAMRPRKGVHYLVRAFSQMKNTQTALLLVGDIKDKRIEKAIAESPRKKQIFPIGKVSQEAALSIAGSVDIITMPSTKREGLPRALIEAMAQGTPAVVTDIGGSPELIENGISGYVVPPADVGALAEALDKVVDDDNVATMGAAARQRINQNFHVSQTVERTWALYNELLAN